MRRRDSPQNDCLFLNSDSVLPQKKTSMKALKKMMKYALYFIFSFSRNLDFCFEVLVKQIGKVNSWSHNLVNKQLQDTYCPISHKTQPVNENWAVNRIQQEKFFLQKPCRKRSNKTSSRNIFVFLKSFMR